MGEFYFSKFEDRHPPEPVQRSPGLQALWQAAAGLTLGLGAWYLVWRWTQSLNFAALWFSLPVLIAETLAYVGAVLFFHDIWCQRDTRQGPVPPDRAAAGLSGSGPIRVDILITTFDEDPDLVALTVRDAKAVIVPRGVRVSIYLLDDGNRTAIEHVANRFAVRYISRDENLGFKAGNLRNALMRTSGDFFVICDADSRLFPRFLLHTLGYFRQPDVAWVQTPHWFYDLPEGQNWRDWLRRKTGRACPTAAAMLGWISGSDKTPDDPYLSDSGLFFDIIQRGRNRAGASFCCGAGSVHRREAVFATALDQFLRDARPPTTPRITDELQPAAADLALRMTELQPFRFHVSEDIYTSILLHSSRSAWTSVYHPAVECKMLSPWGMEAWAAQRLKYAAGTFDIMFHANPLFRRGMPLAMKLHYAATFWSYLATLWLPVLLVAPIVTLSFGIAPVSAYSGAFFLHLVPFLLANELALALGCWGHDVQKGRALAVACMPLNMLAFWRALRNRKTAFKPTPKTPAVSPAYRYGAPHLVLIAATVLAMAIGLARYLDGTPGYSATLIIANMFWAIWNIYILSAAPRAAAWRDPALAAQGVTGSGHEVSDAPA